MFAVLQEVNTSNPRVWIPEARLIVAAMWCRVYFFSTAANVFFSTVDIIAAAVNTSAL